MPLVGISTEKLKKHLNVSVTKEQLITLIEDIGGDVEGYDEVVLYKCSQCGNIVERLLHEAPPSTCDACGSREEFNEIFKDEVVRIELVPSRPDMYDAPGIARVLKGYLGIEKGRINLKISNSDYITYVDETLYEKSSYRPFIHTAIVKNIKMDIQVLKDLMKLQENLHWAIGRNRKRTSIGMYDMDKLSFPIYYKAYNPEELSFAPLAMPERKLSLNEILTTHPKGKMFAHLLKGFKKFPVLTDSTGKILSMPPIINSEETRVSEKTRHLFIDVTGINENDVKYTLNIIIASLKDIGGEIYSSTIKTPEKTFITPLWETETKKLSKDYVNRILGLNLTLDEITELIQKMRFDAYNDKKEDKIVVNIPPYRKDILHPIDIVEDIAIAYGYNNFKGELLPAYTPGKEQKIESFSALISKILTGMEFIEVLNLMLTNKEDHLTKFGLDKEPSVEILNPASQFQSIVRMFLIPGLLSIFKLNRNKDLPQKIFEIADVITEENRRERHMAIGVISSNAGFSLIKSIVNGVLREIKIEFNIKECNQPFLINGRCANIIFKNKNAGYFGEIAPQVLNKFNLQYPVVVCEINLDLFI